MDQRIALSNAILTAINKVNTSIQKTQTYKDGNTYSLINAEGQGVVEISGVGAILAFLGVLTLVPGITNGVSSTISRLSVVTQLDSFVVGISTATASGELDVFVSLGSGIVESSGVGATSGSLDVSADVNGSVAGISEISGFVNHHLLDGVSAFVASIISDLDVMKELQGSCDSEASNIAAKLWV